VSPWVSFEQFVDQHVDGLLHTATLITWDEAEAEDLVQECLLRVAKRWPRVCRMELPGAYARRVLINLALDGRDRRSRRRVELSSPAGNPDTIHRELTAIVDHGAELRLGSIAPRAELMAALGQLSPQQRAVLMLRYFEDLSEAQTAELLGCGVGSVKSSASRGLARLRVLIAANLPPRTSSSEASLSPAAPAPPPSKVCEP